MWAAVISCLALAGCGRIGFGFGGSDVDASPGDATDAPVDACPSHWAPPTRLAGPSTNSAEYAPGFSGDGLELYFESNRNGGNDIWVATRDSLGSEFGTATLASVSSTDDEDIAPFMSADGRTLYFASNRNGADRLYQATRPSTSGPFATPVIVPGFEAIAVRGATISRTGDEILWATGPSSGISRATRVQGTYVFDRVLTELGMTARFPSLSEDSSTLYFGAMGASSVDLYTSTRDASGTFGAPKPISLNDIAWDGDPDVSRDSQTLVFASERTGGEGSGDLWISSLVCD